MRISSRVKIGGGLIIFVLLVFGVSLMFIDRTMNKMTREVKQANEIVGRITTLRSLTQDYLLYHTERAQRQWSAAYTELRRLLDQPDYQDLQNEYGFGDVPAKLKIVGDTFSRLLTLGKPSGPGDAVAGELQNRLATQLLLGTQDLLTRFLNLTDETYQKLIAIQRLSFLLDLLAILILVVVAVSNIVFLQRSVVRPVLKLQEGAAIIGAGNLDHKVGLSSRDEIGQLSRDLDGMTANLKEMTDSLQQKEERLRFLSSQLLTVQEEERGRLARELHDDLGQSLLVLRMQINAAARQLPPETGVHQGLKEAAAYLLEIIQKVRRTSWDLSPSSLEHQGLLKALESLFEEFQRHRHNDMLIEADLDEVKDILSREANIVVYRLAQEFLSNVHKHAGATRVKMAVKVGPAKVMVTMEDNGRGFDLEEVKNRPRERGGLGLVSMEQRLRILGSRFSLTSQIGQGTRLYFEIPRTPGGKLSEAPIRAGVH